MAIEKITKEAEVKLLNSLDQIKGLVAAGESPSEAIVKTARDADLPQHQTQLLIQAYNNAKFNRQRSSSKLLEEKVAHFELADPKVIFNELYPNVKEAAAKAQRDVLSGDYNRPPEQFALPTLREVPALEKQASTKSELPHEPARNVKRAWSLLKSLESEYEDRRRTMATVRNQVDRSFNELLGYFKQAYHIPLNEVKANAEAYLGEKVGVLVKHLVAENPRLEKEASAPLPKVLGPCKFHQAPYTYITTCLEKSAEFAKLQDEFQDFSKEAGAASSKLVSHFLPTPPKRFTGSIVKQAEAELTEKKAIGEVLAPIAQGFGQAIGSKIPSVAFDESLGQVAPKPTSQLESKSLTKLLDPAHEQKLRQLRAQAVFHDLVANDEFLSGEHPDKVSKLYNEITRISPRSSDQPLMMRALLRRYLAQGQVDPHDVDQLAGIENKLKEREKPITAPPLPPEAPTA